MKTLFQLMKSLIAVGLLFGSVAEASNTQYFLSIEELQKAYEGKTGFVFQLGYLEYDEDDIYEGQYYLQNPYSGFRLGVIGDLQCFIGDVNKLKTVPSITSSGGDPARQLSMFVEFKILDKNRIQVQNVVERRYYIRDKVEKKPFHRSTDSLKEISRCL